MYNMITIRRRTVSQSINQSIGRVHEERESLDVTLTGGGTEKK